MPRYVIERDIPKVGDLTPDQLREASKKSCAVIDGMGEGIHWIHSYVTGDRIYCIYDADDEGRIREHADKSGFPANRISRVRQVISPLWGE